MKDNVRDQVSVATVAASGKVSWADFGPFLQRMRRRRGISQEKLAASLGCHRTYIWRLEHGRNRPSRILLHSLESSYALIAEEAAILRHFKQLHAYQMEEMALA